MRYLCILLAAGLYGLWAQCPQCTRINNNNPDVNYDPPVLVLPAGATNYQATVQFALLDSMQESAGSTTVILYPNFGIFVDSLRMYGPTLGSQYQVPGSLYDKNNPANGLMRFDRPHADNFGGTNYSVIPYANLKKHTPNIPPHGCVTVCLSSVPNTPGAEDSVRIALRAYVKVNFTGSNLEQDTQDTTSFESQLFGVPTYRDTYSVYKIQIQSTSALGKPDDIWSQGFELYPNPTSGKVNLRFEIRRPTEVVWKVIDILGKEVYSTRAYYQPGLYQESLSLPSLPPGIYFVSSHTETESYTEKLLIE